MAYMDTTPQAEDRPINRLVSLKLLYKLTPSQGLAMEMLMGQQLVTSSDLVEAAVAPTDITARTVMKRLRAALKGKVEIQNKYAVGYWINPEAKLKVTDELIKFNYPER